MVGHGTLPQLPQMRTNAHAPPSTDHEQTRSRENFVIHSITLDAAWPEMTGQNMQRVAKHEPDMLSRRFRLTRREQLVTAALQGESVFPDPVARLSRRGRKVRVLDRSSAPAVAASHPHASQRYRLAVSRRRIPAALPDQSRRNRRPRGPSRVKFIAPIGGPNGRRLLCSA
jgi:hypothetical protein